MTVQLINVGLVLLLFSCLPKSRVNGESKYEEILFPNGSPNRNSSPRDQYSRALATPDPNNPPEGVDDAVCVICHGLEYCDVLNGLLIEEVYYPKQDELGTCSIIEALGIRMDSEIFGIGRTFRDTTQCRDIVMQYLCLFWGSQNDMYTNLCFWKEDVSSPDPDQHKISPRPPCRSFCVQVCIVNAIIVVIEVLIDTVCGLAEDRGGVRQPSGLHRHVCLHRVPPYGRRVHTRYTLSCRYFDHIDTPAKSHCVLSCWLVCQTLWWAGRWWLRASGATSPLC